MFGSLTHQNDEAHPNVNRVGGVGDERELLYELNHLGVREQECERRHEQGHWIRPRVHKEEAAPPIPRAHLAVRPVVHDDLVTSDGDDAKLELGCRTVHADHGRARNHRHRVIASRKENDDLPTFRAHPAEKSVNRVGVLRHRAVVERGDEIEQYRNRQKSPWEWVETGLMTIAQKGLGLNSS